MTEPDLPRILCPTCSSGEFNFPSDDSAQCPHCSATFPVEKGILKLLPESPGSRSLAQIFMEWDPLIHIYEGTLWRKNPLFTYGLFGISFKEEFEEVVNAAGLSESEVILDLACGPGIYSRPLAKKLKKGSVTGLDLSLPMLKYAVSHAGNEKIDNFIAVHGNALNLPFSVDVAVRNKTP